MEGGGGGRARIICNMDNLWFIGVNSLLRERDDVAMSWLLYFAGVS